MFWSIEKGTTSFYVGRACKSSIFSLPGSPPTTNLSLLFDCKVSIYGGVPTESHSFAFLRWTGSKVGLSYLLAYGAAFGLVSYLGVCASSSVAVTNSSHVCEGSPYGRWESVCILNPETFSFYFRAILNFSIFTED